MGDTAGSNAQLLPLQPLTTLKTGAFHFCQFALARWRHAAQVCLEVNNQSSDAAHEQELDGIGQVDEGKQNEANMHPGQGDDSLQPEADQATTDGLTIGAFAENMLLAPCHETNVVRNCSSQSRGWVRKHPLCHAKRTASLRSLCQVVSTCRTVDHSA